MDLKGNGYRLVFEENFNGGMETNKWKALDETVKAHSAKDNKETVPTHVNTQAASKHAGAELHYIPENVCCENGELVIRADRDGDGFTGGKAVCNGFVFSYGYIEVTALVPDFQNGVWPVFGFCGTDGTVYKPMVDIIAVHGAKGKNAAGMYMKWTDDIYETQHSVNCLYDAEDRYRRFYPSSRVPDKLTPGYHVFAVEWTKDRLKYSCDGEVYCQVDITAKPFDAFTCGALVKLTAGLSVGLPNIDPPDANTVLPTEFKIKNIKVYQNDGIFVKR